MTDDDGWFRNARGNLVKRFGEVKRPDYSKRAEGLAVPMIAGDNLDDVAWGMDGKPYFSKSELRKTYLPSGNPQGERYIELGNERRGVQPVQQSWADEKAQNDAIDKTISTALDKLGA